MSNFDPFVFDYPVTAHAESGKISLVSTVRVHATAYFYWDGSVRTVDITEVKDGDRNDITFWIAHIETMEGNLKEALEAAAHAHAVGKYEEKGEPGFIESAAIEHDDPLDIFGSLGKILKPSLNHA